MSNKPARNLFDDTVFKPLADIGQGKTMRLRLSLWNNCLQFSTKINDAYANLNLDLGQFGMVENWVIEETNRQSRKRNIAISLKKGRDNVTYGQLVFGVGDDGIWFIGGADTSGTRVKHRFIPSVKYSYAVDGAVVEDAEMSYRLFRGWLKNVRSLLPTTWAENYKSPDELAYKPGQGGGGSNYNQPQQSYQQPARPVLDFDTDIQF